MSQYKTILDEKIAERQLIALKKAKEKIEQLESLVNEPIAVIGIACRFPGANNPEQLWDLLINEQEAITSIPDSRWNIHKYYANEAGTPHKMYIDKAGFIKDVDKFDASFFGISPREAESMDPQQRILLELSWEVLENSEVTIDRAAGINAGVFIGISASEYSVLSLSANATRTQDAYTITGISLNAAAGRISYTYGFTGPSMAIDTACSSSLVAVHLACRSLVNRECSMAMAGGINLLLSPESSIALSQNKVLSKSGSCKAFSADADGLVRSEGCGMIILKRLEDAIKEGNHILGIIKASGVNQDGASSGLTVPNGNAQTKLIKDVLKKAKISPESVAYVEAHGTGTVLGDPIELHALHDSLCESRDKSKPLLVGSIKTNIGHLEAASGIAGLIKIILTFKNNIIPAHINFTEPNPHVTWDNIAIKIANNSVSWEEISALRIAGVSSFGFSGTNAHVILEDTQCLAKMRNISLVNPITSQTQNLQALKTIFVLSAKTPTGLSTLIKNYLDIFNNLTDVDWRELCVRANRGRTHFNFRICVIVSSLNELIEQLTIELTKIQNTQAVIPRAENKICFLFSGIQLNFIKIGKYLYDTQPSFKQVIEECDKLLHSYLPVTLSSVMWGENQHLLSTGQYLQVGSFVLEYSLAIFWSHLGLSCNYVSGYGLGEYVAACFSGVFSLPDALLIIMKRGIILEKYGYGQHFIDAYAEVFKQIKLYRPNKTFISLGLNNKIHEEISKPDYWLTLNVESPHYENEFRALHEKMPSINFQIGNQVNLYAMYKKMFSTSESNWVKAIDDSNIYDFHALEVMQQIYLMGININWSHYYHYYISNLKDLPNYPFEKKSYWLNANHLALQEDSEQISLNDYIYKIKWLLQPVANITAPHHFEQLKTWLIFTPQNTFMNSLIEQLRKNGQRVIIVELAYVTSKIDLDHYTFNHVTDHIEQLFLELNSEIIDEVIYGWALNLNEETNETLNLCLEFSCNLPLKIIQQYNLCHDNIPQNIWCITSNAVSLNNQKYHAIFQSPILGMMRSIRQESSNIVCRNIDIDQETLFTHTLFAIIYNEQIESIENEVVFRGGERYVPRLINDQTEQTALKKLVINQDKSYLITGGQGALGLHFTKKLYEAGAKNIILVSRHNQLDNTAQNTIDLLRKNGACIELVQANVSSYNEIENCVNIANNIAPLAGIIHAAGINNDMLFTQLTTEALKDTFTAKVIGSWNLYQITKHMKLDFWASFSSLSSVLGSPGQANYSAANSFLDTFSHYLHQLEINHITINWGPIADIGMSAKQSLVEHFKRVGLIPIPSNDLMALFTKALSQCSQQIICTKFDRNILKTRFNEISSLPILDNILLDDSNRQTDSNVTKPTISVSKYQSQDVLSIIKKVTADVLKIEDIQTISNIQALSDFGLDSLMSLEIKDSLANILGIHLPVDLLYNYPSIEKIFHYIKNKLQLTHSVATLPINELKQSQDDIAVIGMSCRFPGNINTPEELWQALIQGNDQLTDLKQERWNMDEYYSDNPETLGTICTRRAGIIGNIDKFDGEFFGLAPREIKYMDPQQRILMEVSWEALERSGYDFLDTNTVKGGIFIGPGPNDYIRLADLSKESITSHMGTGSALSILAGRLSYFLGWQGPSMVIDTACSSSLTAVHVATKNLRDRECDIALAGGINLLLTPETSIMLSMGKMLATEGKCKAFDIAADGYVRSEGCGIVVLKRVSDAIRDNDNILAIIKGSAINQDGRSQGLTAPNGTAQEAVMNQALASASLLAKDISYVEAHGTGTQLGDPIELHAISNVYTNVKRSEPLIVSSVKTNIGHTESAAGIAGLIKTVLCLQHKAIPAHLHFTQLNPKIELTSPLEISIPTKNTPWNSLSEKRKCAVSSFGFSGTNVHIILEEGVEKPKSDCKVQSYLLKVSAISRGSLKNNINNLINYLDLSTEQDTLENIAYSASLRQDHEYRCAIVANTKKQAKEQLKKIYININLQHQIKNREGRYLILDSNTHEWNLIKQSIINDDKVLKLFYKFYQLITDNPIHSAIVLDVVAKLYAYGICFKWSTLFATKPNKVVLPTYAFERTSYWINDKEIKESKANTNDLTLGLKVAFPDSNNHYFIVNYTEHQPFNTLDHLIFDQIAIPGAAHLAFIFNCYRSLTLQNLVKIKNIYFPEVLRLARSNSRTVNYEFSELNDQNYTVKVASRDENNHWQNHVKATIEKVNELPKLTIGSINNDDLYLGEFTKQQFYETINVNGINLGNSFQWVDSIKQYKRKAIAEVYNDVFTKDDSYLMLPGLLDSCLQTIALATNVTTFGQSEMSGAYIPISIEEITYTGIKVNKYICITELRENYQSQDSIFTHDISLFDTANNPILLIKGLITKRISKNSIDKPASTLPDVLFINSWITRSVNEENKLITNQTSPTLLILEDEGEYSSDLISNLKINEHTIISLKQAKQFKRLNDNSYLINLRDMKQIIALFTERKKIITNLTGIIDLRVINHINLEGNVQDTAISLIEGVLNLSQSFRQIQSDFKTRIYFITSNLSALDEKSIAHPIQGVLSGISKSLQLESVNLIPTIIDVNQLSSGLLNSILYDELHVNHKESFVVYQNEERYVQRIQKVSHLEKYTKREIQFLPDKAYIITGGAGDLGLHFLQWLLEQKAKIIYLLGRSALSTEIEAKIDELAKGNHAQIIYHQLNITNLGELNILFKKIQNSQQSVAGIIHAAGVLDDKLFYNQTIDSYKTVFESKVSGSWNLHTITKDLKLDFFVMFSSAAALFGAVGQSNYSAANSFMDALAHYRRHLGIPALSINWGGWDKIGMASKHKSTTSNAFKAIDPKYGLEIFSKILAYDVPQIGIIPIDLAQLAQEYENTALIPPLINDLFKELKQFDGIINAKNTFIDELQTMTIHKRKIAILETIVRLTRKVLNLNEQYELNYTKSLQDIGLDSIMTIEFKNMLEQTFNCNLPISLLFDYPSINSLAQYFEERLKKAGSVTDKTADLDDENKAATFQITDLQQDELADILHKLILKKEDEYI